MPHTPVPASELAERLTRLRCAMAQRHPDWSMLILDNKIDLYYFTGTMQQGALILTPDQAVLFVRRSLACAEQESQFADIRPMSSFRAIAEAFPNVPDTVHTATKTMTLQKQALLQKHLPFTRMQPVDDVLAGLRAVKSTYELDCMRHAGRLHRTALEEIAPSLLRPGISEAWLCASVCTWLLTNGAMGISRYNQPAAEDVLGLASFGENSLRAAALDSPSGTVGTCVAMKSVGSSQRLLRRGDIVLLDIPSGFRGYHTDKSICFYFDPLSAAADSARLRAAHEQCVFLEQQAAALLVPGAVPSEVYEKICALVDPAFRTGFMNACKFLGHSIGLTMDETPVLAKGFDAPLQAGMTLAVEPKIAFAGIGLIGSENTYEIVADGPARSLSGACSTAFEICG